MVALLRYFIVFSFPTILLSIVSCSSEDKGGGGSSTPIPALSITSYPAINISNQMTYEVDGDCGEYDQEVTVALADSGSGGKSSDKKSNLQSQYFNDLGPINSTNQSSYSFSGICHFIGEGPYRFYSV